MYTGREGSIAVIVSPLTSLMMDQKLKFTPTGICVESYHKICKICHTSKNPHYATINVLALWGKSIIIISFITTASFSGRLVKTYDQNFIPEPVHFRST